MKIVTNHQHRDVLDSYQLTPGERADFDYLDWDRIQAGEDSASFFRYRGELYDIGEFTHIEHPYFGMPDGELREKWDGIQTDSAFSATVIRHVDNYEGVVVGRVYS